MQELWLFGKLEPVSQEEAKKEERDLEALANKVIAAASKKHFEKASKSQ